MPLYKTIVLELLQQRPELQEQLRRRRMLLTALEFYARELKDLHEASMEHLSATGSGGDPSQEALEVALKELQEGCLPDASSQEESVRPSVEDLLAFLRSHTPPA